MFMTIKFIQMDLFDLSPIQRTFCPKMFSVVAAASPSYTECAQKLYDSQ